MKFSMLFKVLTIVVCTLLSSVCVLSKECTNNIPWDMASHTERYAKEKSKGQTLKLEMFADTHEHHLTPTDDSAWAKLRPRKVLKGEDELTWALMYKNLKNPRGVKGVKVLLNEVSLHDVRLLPDSLHWHAQQTNLQYLLMLDVDRLVWSFRKTAGLPTPGQPYGGWEAPNVELRGHFVGHFMSASALTWASTHNDTLEKKMSAVVSALSACQDKIGTGYLSAFPTELFDRIEGAYYAWAPYYTIHKILAGLLDQYTFAGSNKALEMAKRMVNYFYNRVLNVIKNFTIERHWLSLNEESGGMNDVLYRLYSITGNRKHLTLAYLFDKPCFLGLLAMNADDISGYHSNTHIPLVVGTQTGYEVTGDPLYKEMATYFMHIVNASHAYATGGTSINEFWTDPKRLADNLGKETEESCTTYNMLKVSRNLFRWTKEMVYADYYERALTNGVLSIQRGHEPGAMIYMLPLAPGSSKARTNHGWGRKFDTFWCCQGTGIESFSKLGDSIYFEEEGNVPALYIIQYISSSLNWKSGNTSLSLEVAPAVSWDPRLQVMVTMSTDQKAAGKTSTLKFRIPLWTQISGSKASINGQDLTLPTPGKFLSITRKWSHGDKIAFELPINLRTEAIKDDREEYASIQAILYGPYLLAGLSTGDWDINTASYKSLSDWITPIPSYYNSHLITLSQQVYTQNITYIIRNLDMSLKMDDVRKEGEDSDLLGTFRLISADVKSTNLSKPADFINKEVILEPFNYPGMSVMHQGKGNAIIISNSSTSSPNSVFRLIPGLNGKKGTISLESMNQKGCYIYSGTEYPSAVRLVLVCKEGSEDPGFEHATSFNMEKGLSEYHPISFVAKGARQNFVLVPLLSLRDESYTVYFNLNS